MSSDEPPRKLMQSSTPDYSPADFAADLVRVYPLFDRIFRFPPDALWMNLERMAAMKRLYAYAKKETAKS